jgi:transposase
LLPGEEVDRIEDVWPQVCEHCQSGLPAQWRQDAEVPLRHQVTEIPAVIPTTVEYRLHWQACPCCGNHTRASLPDGVSASAFGPRVVAIVALLSGCYRLSKRMVVSAMKDLFGVDLALGTVSACEKSVSETVAGPVEAAHAYAQTQPIAHADETGWRQENRRAWLWVLATPLVTVFRIQAQRGKRAAQALLGTFRGILVTDRWRPYRWYNGLRQLCWAHLSRDFQAMSEHRGVSGHIGHELVKRTKKLFKLWYRVRDGTLTRQQFQRKMRPLRTQVKKLLLRGQRRGLPIAGMCKEMLKDFRFFFTFVDHEGVEPTNNHAERQIRPGVMWRKTSFGTQSAAGSRFVERMLTVRATLRQQGRNVVEYIVDAQQRACCGEAAPSLLPAQPETRCAVA